MGHAAVYIFYQSFKEVKFTILAVNHITWFWSLIIVFAFSFLPMFLKANCMSLFKFIVQAHHLKHNPWVDKNITCLFPTHTSCPTSHSSHIEPLYAYICTTVFIQIHKCLLHEHVQLMANRKIPDSKYNVQPDLFSPYLAVRFDSVITRRMQSLHQCHQKKTQ